MRCLCSGLGVVSMYASLKQCVLRALRACVQGRCRRKTKNGSGVKIRDIFSVQRVARSAMSNKDVKIRCWSSSSRGDGKRQLFAKRFNVTYSKINI